MSKTDIQKQAEALAEDTVELLRAVVVKANIGIIEGAAEAVRNERRQLQRDLSAWAESVGVLGANHLTKVRDELAELEDAPGDRLEMADVLLALMLHAEQRGVDLLAAAHEKLAIVKTRTYGKPDERGVVRHMTQNANVKGAA